MKYRIGFGLSLISVVAISLSLFAQQAPSPVADAAKRGDAAAVTKLLKQGADVNAVQGEIQPQPRERSA